MSHFHRLFNFLIFFLISIPAFSGIGIGKWRTHYSYNNVRQVTDAGDKVFAVANGKLFSMDNDGVLSTYSTLTGLSGFDIAYTGWSEQEKTLLVVYSDGNLDFLVYNKIHNLPDFKNKSMTADKTIYSLRMEGRFAYLSTGVGLVVIDIKSKEIKETFIPALSNGNTVAVNDAVLMGDTIILATNGGLFEADRKNNLLDPSQWKKKAFIDRVNPLNIVKFSNRLFIYADNGIVYMQSGIEWKSFIEDPEIIKLECFGGYLFFCGGKRFYIHDSEFKRINAETTNGYDITYNQEKQVLYIAAGKQGLVMMSNIGEGFKIDQSNVKPNGPSQVYAWNSFFKNGTYYSTTGGRWGDRFNNDGDVIMYKDETWRGLKDKDKISESSGMPFLDILNMAIDPEDDGHFFLTSWGEGLYEFRDSIFYKLHNQYNSPLVTMIPDKRFCRVDGASFDALGNLWVLNSTYGLSVVSDTTIWVLKPDGSWEGMVYDNMPGAPTWNSILFTSRNQIWINSLRVTYGVFVLDQNKTPFDVSDDKTRWFSSFNDQDGINISPFTINCITEDLNGSIWIGTRLGPLVVNNPSAVFDDNFNFTRVKIPRSDGTNSADYLLNEIRVNCITVDGANRKWMGTDGNGLFLLSSDGIKTIHQFTTANSPLPSDFIYSIAIDPETGEVFVGTDAGLVSYRSDAIESKESFGNVHVFPNPVRPGYTGKITVTGLMENTQVKITDINGNLLVSGTSLGGQFGWNGINKKGNRVSSGVYLVFCASEDGTQNQTCKFMVVN